MFGTSPLSTTTPASVRTSIFFSCGSLPKLVSTDLVICLSLACTVLRALGATTCKSFFTLLTPSTPLAVSAAAVLASSESTLPRRNTSPLTVSTRTSRPLTRSSAKSAILVFEVNQLSLVAPFTSCVVSLALFSILSIVPSVLPDLSVVPALSAAPAVSGKASTMAVRSAAPVFHSVRIVRSPPSVSLCVRPQPTRVPLRSPIQKKQCACQHEARAPQGSQTPPRRGFF